MKCAHVHVSVADLRDSVCCYSKLFGAGPVVQKQDYAKWMLEDPRVNFAISSRHQSIGVNHLGSQLDTDDELRATHAHRRDAGARKIEQEQACCYACSDKYWLALKIPVYGEETAAVNHAASATPAPSSTAAEGSCRVTDTASQAAPSRSR